MGFFSRLFSSAPQEPKEGILTDSSGELAIIKATLKKTLDYDHLLSEFNRIGFTRMQEDVMGLQMKGQYGWLALMAGADRQVKACVYVSNDGARESLVEIGNDGRGQLTY